MIGDSFSDIAAGKNSGCRTVWIASSADRATIELVPDLIATDLPSAVQQILRWERAAGA
jgi:beta-phosphoglucomutase-like phosphatase (HAD superfamily)